MILLLCSLSSFAMVLDLGGTVHCSKSLPLSCEDFAESVGSDFELIMYTEFLDFYYRIGFDYRMEKTHPAFDLGNIRPEIRATFIDFPIRFGVPIIIGDVDSLHFLAIPCLSFDVHSFVDGKSDDDYLKVYYSGSGYSFGASCVFALETAGEGLHFRFGFDIDAPLLTIMNVNIRVFEDDEYEPWLEYKKPSFASVFSNPCVIITPIVSVCITL